MKDAEGFSESAELDALLSVLVEISTSDDGWRILYEQPDTHALWELSYPASEMHGGGPRQLRQLAIRSVADWA